MLSISAFAQALIPLYMMSIIGFIARKFNIFPSHANDVITQLMLYVTLPALIIFSLNVTFSINLLIDFIWLILMSIFVLIMFVLIAALLSKKANLPQTQKNVYESLIIFGNQGFIGFAIIYILMGNQGIIYLTLFNILYFILIWTYGIYLFTKNDKQVKWKTLIFNPGILSTVIGIILMFIPFKWPFILLETFETVGKMTVPLSMILIGSLLAELDWKDFNAFSKNIYIWIAAICKLLLIPGLLLIFLFFNVPYSLLVIAVLTSAMPNASTITAYAQKFGGDSAFASFGVLLTTLLCIITIPLLYILMEWLYPYFY